MGEFIYAFKLTILWCIITPIGVYVVVDNNITHLSDTPKIPATLLSTSDCKFSFPIGIFQTNPLEGYNLKPTIINMSFYECMCDKVCNYTNQPTCCRKFINKTNYFIIQENNIYINSDNSTGVYITPNDSVALVLGLILCSLSVIIVIVIIVCIIDKRKLDNNKPFIIN